MKDLAPAAVKSTRRRTAPWMLGGLVLALLSALVLLQVAGLGSALPPDTAADTLLLYAMTTFNFVAFIVFSFIFVRSLLKLRRERRERQLGSKIKTRMLVYFIGVSLLPITAMAIFSYFFFNRSLEKWFSRIPEEVISEGQRIQERAIDERARNLQEMANLMAVMIASQPDPTDQALLDTAAQQGMLDLVEVRGPDGTILARSQAKLAPEDEAELLKTVDVAVKTGGADPTTLDSKGFDVAISKLPDGRTLVISPLRRGAGTISDAISKSPAEFDRLKARQRNVRAQGLSTLGVLTLLLVFASMWAAIHIARGIATPIQAMAEAANEVARGNLSHRVETVAEDELALLAESFNQMTAQLQENRQRLEANAAEVSEKNLALEERRNYIETVLESLTTGVISLDENDLVTTINAAAAAMLQAPPTNGHRRKLAELVSGEDFDTCERLLYRARRIGHAAEQTTWFRSGNGDQSASISVALTATALRGPTGEGRGVVIVIEDLSELISAQRAAAWSEVARRMAHEIKNPLTPIQLSAERMAKNFSRLGQAENGAANAELTNGSKHANGNGNTISSAAFRSIVDECTSTITREVAGLKAMVDEFSRFARLPHASPEPADLNEVVSQAVALYEDRLEGVRLDVKLAHSLPEVLLDSKQIRRVLVNLIDNALEALNGIETDKRITVATAHDPARGRLLIEIADTGPGIRREDFARLFQPYFSTKGRGTGLGLAIVQRIVVEHGGKIRAESNRPQGAKFIVEIPLVVERMAG
jgi:two-component system nitrogen regulation sensor histidine kinase NtrY